MAGFDWEQKKMQPAAASSWGVSPDGLTETPYLRPGMLSSDGSPMPTLGGGRAPVAKL